MFASLCRLAVFVPASLVLASCAQSPSEVVPNIGPITSDFRAAKEVCEGNAKTAQESFRSTRLENGRDLYVEARAAHSRAISEIISALGGVSLSPRRLRDLLTDADAKKQKFLNWYKAEKQNGHGGVQSLGALVDLAGVLVDLLEVHNAEADRQRKILIQQLNGCYWDKWPDAPTGSL